MTGAKGSTGDKGNAGSNGTNGVSVKSVDVEYCKVSSNTSCDGATWSTTSPSWENGKYIWSRTVVKFSNNTSSTSNPVCITGAKGTTGNTGATGATGKGVSTIVEEYYKSTSNTSQTGGSWSTTAPTWENGKYIWTRSKITYTDSTSTTTTPICVTGAKGSTGDKGNTGATGPAGANGTNGVSVKSVDVQYYKSTSNTSLSGGSWVTTSPSWENGKYIWTKTVTTLSNNTTIESDPVCITGAKGATGDKGNTGATGKGVSTIVEEYYKSTSNTSQTGGTWSTTVPTWENGKYIWTRSKITYTDNSTNTTSPICVTGAKGATGNTGATGPTGPAGANGVSITSVDVEYYKSTSNTSLSGGSWSTTAPTWESGKFLWSRTVVKLSSGSTVTTNPVCITGSSGENGTNLWVNPLFESDKPQIAELVSDVKSPNGANVNLIKKRDHFNQSCKIAVFPNHIYRITVYRKKIKGERTLRSGIWYTTQTSGNAWDTIVNAKSTTALTDGWEEAIYEITCPSTKSKGCIYFQIDQGLDNVTYDTEWYISNLICTDITGLKGDNGETGATGASGTFVYVTPSTYVVRKTKSNTMSPSSVTFYAYKRTGSGNPTALTGTFKVFLNDSTTAAATSGTVSSYSYTVPTNATYVRCQFIQNNVTMDEQRIVVVQDGTNGTNGTNAYSVHLTNEVQVFPCLADGTIQEDTIITTEVLAYQGSTKVTATIGTLPTVTGLTLSKSGQIITIKASKGSALAKKGSFTIPITVGSVSFSKVFNWAKLTDNESLDDQITELKNSYSSLKTTVDNNTKSISTKITQQDVTNSINNYDKTTVSSIKDRVTATENNISGLTSTVSSVQTTLKSKADSSTVTTVSNKVTSLETNLNGFKTTVSNTYTTKTDFNNLSIGGTNLIDGTLPDDDKQTSITSAWTFTAIAESTSPSGLCLRATCTTADTGGFYHQFKKITVGKQYTWSVYIKASKACSMKLGQGQNGYKTVNVTTNWQKVSYTFTATDTTYNNFVFYTSSAAWVVNDIVYYHSLMLEEGNRVTTWCQSVNDIQNGLSDARTEAKNRSDQIQDGLDSNANRISSIENSNSVLSDTLNSTNKSINEIQESIKGATDERNDLRSEIL